MVVASTLLLFKLFGMVSGDLYVFGSREAIAQEADAKTNEAVDENTTDAPTEGEEGEQPVADAAEAALEDNRPKDAAPITLDTAGRIQKLSETTGVTSTEIEFLERLSERRKELDEREAQLEIQESIVRAAELRLETRANELKEIEARIAALVEKKETQDDQQFVALVTTYESMKPKDAARIFDRLDMYVLVRLVERMNPKKFASVIAAMDSEKAEALTINLANPNLSELRQPVAANASNELPQIVGQ
jgi:flagellar motility protein MotE (MotC chaperone)